jgi:hypothetical protein
MKRKGLGIGMGKGYKNLIPNYDSYVHSLSAKGVKTKLKPQQVYRGKRYIGVTKDNKYDVWEDKGRIIYLKRLDAKGKKRELFLQDMDDSDFWDRSGFVMREYLGIGLGKGVKTFETREEAIAYAKEHNIELQESYEDERGKVRLRKLSAKGKKNYYVQYKIGKAKYVVNFHDGVKKHDDGSDFYDIKIFKNKKDLNNFLQELSKKGYRERQG